MASKKTHPEKKLGLYRAKRSAGATPEPMGARGDRPRLFVIQKHAATRLHYDFRLEWGGTLWSWAVPKVPSFDPKVKRMAVQVEDHPVEYADFEGIIPKGNYGAGPVIVWDRGLWTPREDPDQGLAEGKLHFDLRGYKLRGEWILVRTRGATGKEWLLMKKADAFSRRDGGDLPETSILSGLTLEELREGTSRTEEVNRALAKAKAKTGVVDPRKLDLMLAETAEAPFSSPDWIYELKIDGYRVVAARDDAGKPFLRSRNGLDYTATFPEVARTVGSLPYPRLVLDGEIAVLDETGRSDFGRLQERALLRRPADIERATVELPATLFVFDLLGFGDYDLRPLPLLTRKELLSRLLPRAGPVRYADHVAREGLAMVEKVREMRLEGVMAKRASSPYKGGRSPHWLKMPVERTGDFVVCGFTKPQGARAGFGALHVGAYEGGELVYMGRVGTGFSDRQLAEYRAGLEAIEQTRAPCSGAIPSGKEHHWVRPEWVAEVQYKTVTRDGHLRHPVFVRLRDDKTPRECTKPGWVAPEPVAPAAPEPPPARPKLEITRPEKVFWPGEKITKGDLIDYYRAVSPWLLPYLADRPLVLTRYPDGIEGKSFYQKNAPDYIPSWLRTVSLWSESTSRDIRYLVVDDEESLLYLVNLGTIPLHLWASRVQSIQYPDWCILDLDPKGAPFAHVLTLARTIHEVCEEIDLLALPKTTGSTGLHVLVPLGGQCTFEQCRLLGQLISKVVNDRHPDISTMARVMSARKGRVYLDYLQNRHGQLIVAPYSVRPLPGAPVSAPLEWKEVNSRLDPRQFTIKNLLPRLRRKKADPLRPVLTHKPDLVGALERLAKLVE